ncbi:spore coat protein [Bacillota bacterium LX-D]|nr:spore coat protein [Bacillota bacterium LX-D]
MQVKLSQKEKMLLEDQKTHEEICIKKYNDYSNKASDPQLKQLFSNLAQQEEQHLNSINQILSGQTPQMSQQQSSQQQSQGQQMQQGMQNQMQQKQTRQFSMLSNQQSNQTQMSNNEDAFLCNDMLNTEKYISGSYDTTIFECQDSNVRQVLNHIQKEEQQHGEELFNYMTSHGMYQIQ